MHSKVYDYIIIGAGAAGLHLALAICKDRSFDDKHILILDKSDKTQNDRTWCFWEKGDGLWDSIISHAWPEGKFISSQKEIQLEMGGYAYKMVKGLNFYNYAKAEIAQHDNINWVKAEVENVNQKEVSEITTSQGIFKARHIFDSRIDDGFYNKNDGFIRLLQHFKGIVIETDKAVFDDQSFTMMDYSVRDEGSTNFTYILPLSKNKALIEFTYFSPKLVQESTYDHYLKKYINEVIGIQNYRIIDTEKGVIPMSNYPFEKLNTKSLTKIGTAGSWVKPSTGYSFKNAERYSRKIIKNIKNGHLPSYQLISKKFRKYDSIFLDVLFRKNDTGRKLFEDMYIKNKSHHIFKFLDEKTSFSDEIKIMSSFPLAPFASAFFRSFLK